MRQPDVLVIISTEPSAERAFQKNHCGSVLQHLTYNLQDNSSDVWFVRAASQQVVSYLFACTEKHSPTLPTTSEPPLDQIPAYTHRQSVGDLLILPPSWQVLGFSYVTC